jgi:hypothetical protein
MLDEASLRSAFAKLKRNQSRSGDGEPYSSAEIAALSVWMALELAQEGKLTREEKRERNRAAWLAGDRSRWGGERRKRDKRRGWRNFKP